MGSRAKKSYVPVNKWTSSGSTSIPHNFSRAPVIESTSWDPLPLTNCSDHLTLQGDELYCKYRLGSETVVNTSNGIRRRVKNLYSKTVKEPLKEREQTERFVTFVDTMR